MKWRTFLFVLLFYTLYAISYIPMAEAASNDYYNLHIQGLDATPNLPSPTPTPEQPSVLIGFPKNNNSSLSFSLSNSFVDFGALSPTNPILRQIGISVNNGSPYGSQVLAIEDHQLKKSDTTIPDTACDSGSCNSQTISQWTNPLTYGFGYRCDGNICATNFPDSFFKRLANSEGNEPARPLILLSNQEEASARITFKVNISGTQAQGAYSNTITFIAVPNY